MESAVLAPPIEDPTDNWSLRSAYVQMESLVSATRCSQMGLLINIVNSYDADRLGSNGRDHAVAFLEVQMATAHRVAVEMVDAAIALQHLPLISAAFERGDLTLTQVCLIAQFATAETDKKLARTGNQYSLNQLKKLAADAKTKERKERESSPNGKLKIHQTNTRVKGHFDYPIEQGLGLLHALDRGADAEGLDEATGMFRPQDERRADALLAMANAEIADDADPDLATVSIAVDLDQLPSTESEVVDVDGRSLLLNDIRHLLCDMRYQVIGRRNNETVGISRLARTIPAAIRRLMNVRDNGCRFPGCQNTKAIDGHHIQWWSLFGPTNLDNLISLCRRHHRFMHKGWTIEGDPNGFVVFKNPEGKEFTARPPGLDPVVRDFAEKLLNKEFEARQQREREKPPLSLPSEGPAPNVQDETATEDSRVYGSWADTGWGHNTN